MAIPDHIRQLRRLVGPETLLWIPGVNAVVVDESDRVLLHRRSEDRAWSVLSGILDPGEEPAAGVVREVLEETGVHVLPEAVTSVTVSPPVTHANGDRAQYLEICFRCRPLSGQARVNDDESIDVAWFAADELPALEERSLLRIRHALDRSQAWFTPARPGLTGIGQEVPEVAS
ncbi:NUDIX hydrolase [Streptomyces sp. NPDC018610]|uniref:NUDIX hydrolase n=1 Tax=Streptomyces sp. NPDC018610 TaxID=3365049 RepID=UPI0037A7346F